MGDRLLHPISDGELERRWTAVRAEMRARSIEALVMQSTTDWLGGYVKWFTDIPAYNGYPRSVIFHADDPMTVVDMGPRGGARRYAGRDPIDRGVGEILSTSAFVSVAYTEAYQGELVAGELKRRGYRTIGWLGAGNMLHGLVARVEAELAGRATFLDASDFVDRIKAIKSEEERALVRSAAAMQDEVFRRVLGKIRPGMRHFEVTALAQYEGRLLGSEQGLILATHAPLGHRLEFLDRYWQGHAIHKGEHFSLLIENNGPGGMYTEIARTLVFGKASNQLIDGFEAMKEAQAATLARLKPGASCREVAEAHDAFMNGRGLPPERRLYCHGQGYDLVERPLVRADETMTIEKNMNFAVHPGFAVDGVFSVICDNYLIENDGPTECLHNTPKQIFEIN
ncbi:MAG TPA: M24 family metallopeptidase [Xanthobacteraceae bacterium]